MTPKFQTELKIPMSFAYINCISKAGLQVAKIYELIGSMGLVYLPTFTIKINQI